MPSVGSWPAELPAVQVRVARPTAQLDRIVEFYRDVLHLPVLHSANDHEWSVVMFGLPGDQYNIEFVPTATASTEPHRRGRTYSCSISIRRPNS